MIAWPAIALALTLVILPCAKEAFIAIIWRMRSRLGTRPCS